jgi:hypothetical protein
MIQKTKKRSTLHLGVDADLEGKLDAIVAHMKADPMLGSLQAQLGREKAARYAILRTYASLPRGGGE